MAVHPFCLFNHSGINCGGLTSYREYVGCPEHHHFAKKAESCVVKMYYIYSRTLKTQHHSFHVFVAIVKIDQPATDY